MTILPDHNKLQYMLFDWDGTLADNRNIVICALEEVLKKYNLPCWEKIKEKRHKNLSLRDNFSVFFGDKSFDAYEEYVQIYKQISPKMIKPFSGAEYFMRTAKEEGIELIIMTNKDRRLLEIELPLLYDISLFSRIVCGHEALRDKPYPEHIFHALQGLLAPFEINQNNVWMIGDSDQDSDCALAAGALPIRINQSLFSDNKYVSEHIVYFNNFESLSAKFLEKSYV